MFARTTLLALAIGWIAAARAPGGEPPVIDRELVIKKDNTRITRSARIKPGTYHVEDRDRNGVLRIEADNVVLDFQGAVLASGKRFDENLDRAEGYGVVVAGARNVTIKNARIHGYFVNIQAMKAPGLTLEACDASFSRAHRIRRGPEPVRVWLHLRSIEAWRSYGAGYWLERCDGSTIRRCRAGRAQNGLLLVDSNACTVIDSDFSFNSGFGLGLWGASRNTVAWNRIDFVNRPWGSGWGGDSAGLVVVNGANENDIVGNSLTHGGDGFFLTDRRNGGLDRRAGTSNIEGSCDRNLVALNDGSWSPCNAFEGTFSKGNIYYRNRADDSGYGFWLGYSDGSLLLENEILRPRVDGIAIEHGSGTRIFGNTFVGAGRTAIALWSSPGDWIDKLHPSRDIDIRENDIRDCKRAFHLEHSSTVSAGKNRIENTPESDFPFTDRPSTGAGAAFKASARFQRFEAILEMKPAGFRYHRDGPGPKGIPWIQVDAFSPRDFRDGLVAWRMRDAATLELHPLVGEELRFDAPHWIRVERDPETATWTAAAQASPGGIGEVKDYTIKVRPAGGGRSQTLTGRMVTAVWDVRWYRWDRPKKLAYDDTRAWKRLFKSPPIHRQSVRELSRKLWASGPPPGVPGSHFALVAETRIRLPGGRYRLSTTSDDGIRVFLNGKEVISRWNQHGPTPDRTEVKLRPGVHRFVIHYCQESGASALEFHWRRMER